MKFKQERKRIERILRNTLLNEGMMDYELYIFELEENHGYWLARMERDKNDFIFTMTEHSNEVAMALVDKTEGLFVNEKAREKLQELWEDQYANNINKLITYLATELAAGSLPLIGVKFQKDFLLK